MAKAKSNLSTTNPGASKKHSILLTKEQYFALLKTVYLGNWVANASRDGSEAENF